MRDPRDMVHASASGAPEVDDPPLTEQQMQLMAYVDDDMSPDERLAFEMTLRSDAALAAEVARHQNLVAMTQSMAQLEPSDFEARRFWSQFYNRSEWRVGWCFLILGLVILLAELLHLLLTLPSDVFSTWAKVSVLFMLGGGGILLWNNIRLRMRTSHFDRYRGVMR